MKQSTAIALAVGAVLLLVAVLAISKALTPRPKTTLETVLGGAPGIIAAFA